MQPETKQDRATEEAKAALRLQIRDVLKKMTEAERIESSRQACARLEEQGVWKKAGAILFYAPLTGELDIWRLVVDSLAAGKTVALPRFIAEQQVYEAWQIKEMDKDLWTGKFGVREPREHCQKIPLNRLDLVLVPGIAFDPRGGRLGRGRGFYDRLLAAVNGLKCGVAFDEQLVDAVPVGPMDVRLNCILTPTRWIET